MANNSFHTLELVKIKASIKVSIEPICHAVQPLHLESLQHIKQVRRNSKIGFQCKYIMLINLLTEHPLELFSRCFSSRWFKTIYPPF